MPRKQSRYLKQPSPLLSPLSLLSLHPNFSLQGKGNREKLMEKSFATFRNQTLVFSTSSQSHIHNPITRRDVLGCGALQLRRPSIVRYRFRDRKRKLKFGICTEIKCSMNESEGADSIIAIAVAAAATLGMLRIVYLSNGGKKKMNEVTSGGDEKGNALVSSKLCEHDADTSESQHNVERFLSSQDVSIQPTVNNNIYEDIKHDTISEVDVQKKVWTCEKISVTDVQPKDELAYSNEFRDLSLTTMMVNEVKSVGGEFASKLPNLLSQMEVGPTVSCSSIFILDKEKESDDVGHIAAKPCEALISSNDVSLRESIKEVSSCNSERQNGVSSISHIKHLNTEPGQLDHKGKDTYSNRLKTVLKDSDTSAKRPTLTEDSQSLTGCSKEVLVGKENGLLKTGIHRQIKFSRLPQQNGITNDFSTPASYIRTYNSLLKAGRLRDCVELLEEMEKKEMLDMEKVHHSKFLNTCKSQKTVNEAFRFCKLIRKPTLSTFNMLLSVCASSQDFEGAFQAMVLVKEAGLVPDCKLYTTLISTCAKSGKVDAMFEIFHEAVNAGVEPNLNTYGALIDGCARAGQVAKAFGAYGIMRSKKVQPDRVIFNALITACGQSGAVDRAFDVLAEMRAETRPIDPDHVTIGALIKTCSQSGQVDRVREVYKMLQKYKIKGTPEVYTIAVNSCSQTGDLEFALSIYNDMKINGVVPDEMFLSTIIDVAGHAGKVDTAFEILRDARSGGIKLGNFSYSSLMGACCNGKNWQKALELYEEIMAVKLIPTVSTLNALVTSLCDGDQLHKAVEVLDEIREAGVKPNVVTYSILIVACEKKGEAELGFTLFSKAKGDGILPNQIMCRCLTGLCLKSLEKAISLGDNIVTFNSGKPQINSKWTTLAIMAYRETISAGVIPTIEVFSQVLGCLQFPRDSSLKNTFIENLDIQIDISKCPNIYSLLDGFGEYDIRCFSVHEEAASLGVIPRVSFKDNPIVVDARKLPIHTVEVHLLTIIKGLKHRLAAGARLPNINVLLPVEKIQMDYASGEKRTINVAGRIGQSVCSMLRRVGLRYTGDASFGKIRISGLSLRRWFKPKLSESSASGKAGELVPVQTLLSKGIMDQQRNIRSIGLSLD